MPHLTFSFVDFRIGPLVPCSVAVGATARARLLAAGSPVPVPIGLRGLIDTGASMSGVSAAAIDRLGLASRTSKLVSTAAERREVPLYETILQLDFQDVKGSRYVRSRPF
jgi:hypothetical protein